MSSSSSKGSPDRAEASSHLKRSHVQYSDDDTGRKMKKSSHASLAKKTYDSSDNESLSSDHKRHLDQIKTLKSDLARTKFECTVFQAIVRQYRHKLKNIRLIAMAGIDRDDILMEHAESCIERNILPDNVQSDAEDDLSNNQISYSYTDNELFKNEL